MKLPIAVALLIALTSLIMACLQNRKISRLQKTLTELRGNQNDLIQRINFRDLDLRDEREQHTSDMVALTDHVKSLVDRQNRAEQRFSTLLQKLGMHGYWLHSEAETYKIRKESEPLPEGSTTMDQELHILGNGVVGKDGNLTSKKN